ncbi:MAG: uncharacterized protein KVP18_003234 [Porospora cf. gigantea A]|nr:MAG: hypothetical protein KVP18_003234 [Porospora cf. gigantea A]
MKKWLFVWLTLADDPLDGVVRHFEDRKLLQMTTGNIKDSTTSPTSQPANHPMRAPAKKRVGSLWPWPVEPPNLTREALICALNTELKGLSGERAITDYLLCVSCPEVPPYDQRKGKLMVGVGLRMLKIKDFNLFTGELVITVW